MLRTSPEIGNIATALSAFQSEVEDAQKTSQAHNYRYADLHTILTLIRPLMGKHGLSLTQFPIGDQINTGVCSRLMHTSGEWMELEYTMGVTEGRGMSTCQASGMTLSYARRYAATAILGIASKEEDEDGHVEEPEITPASDEEFALINDYIEAGQVSKRRLSWLKVKKNWNNLTSQQAQTILNEIRGL